MRRKLKIRDLFQRIDALCAEGRLSESLFDSEGQIDSEDVGGYHLKLNFYQLLSFDSFCINFGSVKASAFCDK